MTRQREQTGTAALERLRAAKRVGYVLSGGSVRCAFQIGAVETLRDLGIRASVCVGVSAGVWNAAAIAAGTDERLRYYWRCFARYPYVDPANLFRGDRSPFLWSRLHQRAFERYVGNARLKNGALPLFVSVTRLRDRTSTLLDVRGQEDPFRLLLAANYLPPFYSRTPLIEGERYGDGGVTDNVPYEKAFSEGCDAVVVLALKGESEGGLYRSLNDVDHVIPEQFADRVIVIRPRHRVPVSFVERRWSLLERLMELGRLRAREILLDERHAETDWRASGDSFTMRLAKLTGRWRRSSQVFPLTEGPAGSGSHPR